MKFSCTPNEIRFKPYSLELLYETVTEAGHQTLINRPNEQIHQTGGEYMNFRYRDTLDIEAAADRQYNRVYDIGGGINDRSTTAESALDRRPYRLPGVKNRIDDVVS